MAYSHILMVMLGKEVGDLVWGEGKHYFYLTKFFKKLYVQNILHGGTLDFFYKQLRILLGLRVT